MHVDPTLKQSLYLLLQEATVLDLKSKVQEKDGSLPPYLQRLIHKTSGGATTKLEDGCKLATYSCLRDGATLFLVRLNPCELYVQDAQARLHTLTIPSSEPEVSTLVIYNRQKK